MADVNPLHEKIDGESSFFETAREAGLAVAASSAAPSCAAHAAVPQAAQYGNQVLVAHEDDQFQVVEEWEPVTEADVQTPLEVYQELMGGLSRAATTG
jgi:hypothetical protein